MIDGIVNRAADAAASGVEERRAPDRTAQAPDRTRKRSVRRVSVGLVVVLLVGLGWWYLPIGSGSASPALTESVPEQTQSVPATARSGQEAEALPEWDDQDEVVRLHRRVEQLQTRSQSDTWGGDLQPASQSRP